MRYTLKVEHGTHIIVYPTPFLQFEFRKMHDEDEDACDNCVNGDVMCEKCDGDGECSECGQDCPECDGTGYTDCEECDGTGLLVNPRLEYHRQCAAEDALWDKWHQPKNE